MGQIQPNVKALGRSLGVFGEVRIAKHKGGERGHDGGVVFHHIDEFGGEAAGRDEAGEGEALDLELDLVGGEKRGENDYSSADAPHGELSEGGERGGREEKADERLL